MIALLVAAQVLQPVQPVEAPPQSSLRAPLPELLAEATPEGPPLPLAQALEESREKSPDLAVALERVTQARDNVQRGWSALKPTLTGNASYTYNSVGAALFAPPPVFVKQGTKGAEAASLNFAWSFFNLRAFPALASAYQQVDVARLTETQQRRELLLSHRLPARKRGDAPRPLQLRRRQEPARGAARPARHRLRAGHAGERA